MDKSLACIDVHLFYYRAKRTEYQEICHEAELNQAELKEEQQGRAARKNGKEERQGRAARKNGKEERQGRMARKNGKEERQGRTARKNGNGLLFYYFLSKVIIHLGERRGERI